MGIAVKDRVRSPARISAWVAAGSARARATGSDQTGGSSPSQGRPGIAVTGTWMSSAKTRVARERDRAHGAAGGDQRRADPGSRRLVGQVGAAAAGLLLHVAREREGPAPERELQQRVVRARGDGTGVVGHGELVRLSV